MSDAVLVKSPFIIPCIQYGRLAGTGTGYMLKTNLPPACPSHLGDEVFRLVDTYQHEASERKDKDITILSKRR